MSDIASNDRLGFLSIESKATLRKLSTTDSIHRCGPALLSVLEQRPHEIRRLAHQKLYAWPYKDVPPEWKRLYEDASLWRALTLIDLLGDASYEVSRPSKRNADGSRKTLDKHVSDKHVSEEHISRFLDEIVRVLDMAVILTGAPLRSAMIHTILSALQTLSVDIEQDSVVPDHFPTSISDCSHVEIKDTFIRTHKPDILSFQQHLDDSADPLLITGSLSEWPAFQDPTRQWSNPMYLLQRTLGGRRLVPIELGRSYTDAGWSQKIVTFKDYMHTHLLSNESSSLGYLAQHDLLAQIPELSNDTLTPDYCYCSPPPPGPDTSEQLIEPIRNAWLGPAGTISPLHTDPYHNILCQVVGRKYIRLYPPSETHKLYPRGVDESGINMGNTSRVDVELARRFYDSVRAADDEDHDDEIRREMSQAMQRAKVEFETEFPLFRHAQYVEGILEAGECLYIPRGWWHYIESLQVSFNVSYWFN